MRFADVADFTLGNTTVPENVLDMTALLLIDTLGVAAGAAALEAGQIARSHAVRFLSAPDARDTATLLFDGRTASIPGAAFAAASQIDNLDAHDGYNPTKGHIGCASVPALCAFGEGQTGLSAREALRTLAISYEVAARAAIALHGTVEDYHTSGAWNALGVVAIGARLRGHNAETYRQALGIAEYHGPRSQMMREIANPTMLHDGSGMGAMVGAMAALMAEDGFEGAPAITVEANEVASIWDDLGSHWTILDNYIKPYPICRWAHAALDAVSALVTEHALSVDNIARIKVNTFAQAAALFPGMPCSSSQAQYSLPFALSALLVHGKLGPDEITGAGLSDPAVAEVLSRIQIHEEARHSTRFPAGRWSDATITMQDGCKHHSGDVHARGGPEAPMKRAEVEQKFHTIAGVLPVRRRAEIWAMTERLLEPDVPFSDLMALVVPGIEIKAVAE